MSEIKYQEAFVVALSFALRVHDGQRDKSGAPYILHPLQVAMRCEAWHERVVGVLHDVIEDCGTVPSTLISIGIPEECVAAVEALSRREGETYADFIERIVEAGPLAMRVKLADLEENMRPDRRHPDMEGLSKRYVKAKDRILSALDGAREERR